MAPPVSRVLQQLNVAQLIRTILKSLPASLVISLNAWAVSAWLKATILINSQPRWLFRKKRWSEGEMRAISCYYLVVAYLMLRVVRVTSRLAKRPGRPYGDFFRHTRPLLGAVVVFSLTTMLVDEFFMFYILRKFGLEKRRLLITGRPIDNDHLKNSNSDEEEAATTTTTVSDDDCCICYGAMLDDEDVAETEAYMGSFGMAGLLSKETDHVLENFCVVKSHVAHRGCIRKWYNYGPKGYRPMDAFRAFQWGAPGTPTTTTTAAATTAITLSQPRGGLGWLLSLPLRHGLLVNEQLRIPFSLPQDDMNHGGGGGGDVTETNMTLDHATARLDSDDAIAATTPTAPADNDAEPTGSFTNAAANHNDSDNNNHENMTMTTNTDNMNDPRQPPVATVPLTPPRQQEQEYGGGRHAGRNTCPACRQPLILQFVDLAQGRQDMSRLDKLRALCHDLTKFNDWRGLVLRSAITAGWVGVTIVGGKLRLRALDRSLARARRNRGLASLSSSAATAAGMPLVTAAAAAAATAAVVGATGD